MKYVEELKVYSEMALANPYIVGFVYVVLAYLALKLWFKVFKTFKRMSSGIEKFMAVLSPTMISTFAVYWESILNNIKNAAL